jgi:hypothetical protein
MAAVGMMKSLSFGLALAPIFVAGCIPVYSQVKPGQSINSPLTTYEDADLTDPGAFSIGQYASFVRTGGGNSVSATGLDFSFGLHRRIELSGFGAATFSQVGGNQLAAEPDNSYVGLKFLLGPGGRYRPALAVKPTLELLWGDASGVGHAHFMLPLILQKNIRLCDLALTAGYITRGVAFGAVKCEWSITDRIAPMAVVQSSRMTKDLGAISNLGWNRTEVRGSAGLSMNVSRRWSIFLEAGRTIGRMDQNSSHLDVSASISFTGRLWGRKPSSPENAPEPQALLVRRSECTPTLRSTPYSWPALR